MRDLVVRVRTTVGDFSLEAVMHAPGAGVTGVFGPSGSGKTTLVRCIAGLHRPRHGSIRWGGDVWQDDAKGTFVPPPARRVGYVSQHADLFPHLSVRGNLQYAATRAPAGPHDLSWHDVVTWLALDGMLDRAVTRLSGGERQRVALARALLAQPRLLLLDEPLSALDQPARQEVMRHLEPVLTRVALPVIYVSHALQEVARIADHFVWIRAGRVAEEGPVSRILGNVEFAKWIGDDRGVVLDGVIRDHDPHYELSTITTAVGDLLVPRRSEDPGTPIRVQIKARDVSVGLTPQESSSILNELALDVLETAELSPSDCLVRLGRPDAGETVVMAKITRKSMSHLGVEPGLRMFVRVKSVAVLD